MSRTTIAIQRQLLFCICAFFVVMTPSAADEAAALLPSSQFFKINDTSDPSFVSIGAGYFDIIHGDEAAQFQVDFRSSKSFWILKPFAGVMANSKGAVYGYGGALVDFHFGRRIVVTPSVGVGPYSNGNSRDLGAVVEFRSSLDISYRFNNRSRLGIYFYHISNAGIGDDTKLGTEMVGINYSLPLTFTN